MEHRNRWILAALIGAGLQLTACAKLPEATHAEHPAEVEAIPGSDVKRVTLTERAGERLDLKTDEVRELNGQKVVPYASLIYDPNGRTWVYTSPAPRTFVRHEVEIDRIVGDLVVLKAGPPTGTVVASLAVAELYGTEFAVGH